MTPTAGIGFKASHCEQALAACSRTPGLWFEVHAENYMVAGGPRLAMLEALRERSRVSLHGIGLSLAGAERPAADHLAALAVLVDRFEPFLVSEHLAWSRLGERALPDLLPFPRSHEALDAVCRNVAETQDALRRPILIENPSHYLVIPGHDWSETEFLAEILRRTGCGLLLDLNNVHVSAHNLGFAAEDYLDAIPAEAVAEIHIAGAEPDAALDLLVDSHGAPVAEPVWALLDAFVRRHGPRPVLLERDRDVPAFDTLMAERGRAARVLDAALPEFAPESCHV